MEWNIHINLPHCQRFISKTFTDKEKKRFVREYKGEGDVVCMGYIESRNQVIETYHNGRLIWRSDV